MVAELGLLGWFFGTPITHPAAALYLLGTWIVAGATALFWQLTCGRPISLLSHVAGFTLALVAFA